jgi:3-deoxy-D-manno-octulosonic-acid transferase
MIWWLYNLGLAAFSPAIATWLVYRLAVKGKSRDGLAQRLGLGPSLGSGAPGSVRTERVPRRASARDDGSIMPRGRGADLDYDVEPGAAPGGRIWVHAVSAGEMVAAAAVVRAVRQRAPEVEIVVSTTTPAGMGQARRLIQEARAIFYFPFDYLPCVRRALARVQPSLFVAVETEIWPNFYREATRRGVPIAVVNGHLSDRTMRRLEGRARLLRPLYAAALRRVARFGMQTELDARRAIALGAEPSRVRVCGNTKFDQEVASLTPGEAARLRRAFGLREDQPLWIAGSTHPGEEEQVLDAWQAVRRVVPDLALLIAPRHVERADEVEALCVKRYGQSGEPSGQEHPIVRRSRASEPRDASAAPPVILLDTVGELAALYGLASVVFVGGSLSPIGGHDVLQPLFHGKPTFFGPHMHNQREMAALAAASGAARQVDDVEGLAGAVRAVLTEPATADAMAGAAGALLAANRGAAGRCAELILELIPSSLCALRPQPGARQEAPHTKR